MSILKNYGGYDNALLYASVRIKLNIFNIAEYSAYVFISRVNFVTKRSKLLYYNAYVYIRRQYYIDLKLSYFSIILGIFFAIHIIRLLFKQALMVSLFQ